MPAFSLDEENQHLDRFAETLKAGPPESIGYIFSYAGKNACIYEAGWRAKRIRQYLVEKYNFPTKRLVVVEDRKSTRLNSSHSSISYAVFCLKKKKKKKKYK